MQIIIKGTNTSLGINKSIILYNCKNNIFLYSQHNILIISKRYFRNLFQYFQYLRTIENKVPARNTLYNNLIFLYHKNVLLGQCDVYSINYYIKVQ